MILLTFKQNNPAVDLRLMPIGEWDDLSMELKDNATKYMECFTHVHWANFLHLCLMSTRPKL